MDTPDIGPISPHFGPRRSTPDRRRPRQQHHAFEEIVRRLADEEEDEGGTPAPPDLQRRAPNVRRDGRDGDRHVDVLA